MKKDLKPKKIIKKGEEAVDEVEKATSDLADKLKEVKKKAKDMDSGKKKKILASIVAATGAIGGLIGAKKIKDKLSKDK